MLASILKEKLKVNKDSRVTTSTVYIFVFSAVLQTSKPWTKGEGLYIADIDMCKAGLHNCFNPKTCIYKGYSNAMRFMSNSN